MEFLNSLTDDQTALLGCFAALTVCGIVMALSYHLGPSSRRQATNQPQHRDPNHVSIPVVPAAADERRKAA